MKPLYTPEIVDIICERLSKGEPLAVICREEGMPAYRTVKDWQDEDSERGRKVSAAIARAREAGFDAIAADCLVIADDASGDYRLGEKGLIVDTDHIQRAKLRIDTRLKLLAKWDPKRFGERLDLNHKGDVVLHITHRRMDIPDGPPEEAENE